MALDFDTIVAGGGVIGLAAARALAMRGQSVLVLEAEPAVALHQSSRNSEVIHAGIYYPPGSLKARCCIEGKARLYDYCRSRGVEARAVGKLIVATRPEEVATLQTIQAGARAAGMADLDLIEAGAALRMEPDLACVAALWSPTTGIVDSPAYILALTGDLQGAGGTVVCRAAVTAVRPEDRGFAVRAQADGEEMELRCSHVVNAAGFLAPSLAGRIEGLGRSHIPEAGLAKGSYFSLPGKAPFRHLIYPVPVPGALGTHLTLDLAGQARFGPDIEWVGEVDYRVDPARGEGFYAAIRRYWPGLPDGALVPAYAGVRAKIGPKGSAQDFVISDPDRHGVPGLVSLFGIESPGLTSSLVLADLVAEALLGPA